MDIEMVQKINKLAVDLLNQGMATSRIDAVKKAEEMLSRGGKELTDNNIVVPQQSVVVEAKTEESHTETSGGNQASLATAAADPVVEKLKTAMVKNNEFIVKSLKETQEVIAGFKKQIQELKNEVEQLKKARPAQPTLNNLHQQAGITKPAPQEPTTPSASSSSAPSHPRQGQYNPEDVAVDKVFYMGNK